MKEIRIWGREGFFRKIRCDDFHMDDKSIKMYKLGNEWDCFGHSEYLAGYANLENVNVIEIEDIKYEK